MRANDLVLNPVRVVRSDFAKHTAHSGLAVLRVDLTRGFATLHPGLFCTAPFGAPERVELSDTWQKAGAKAFALVRSRAHTVGRVKVSPRP